MVPPARHLAQAGLLACTLLAGCATGHRSPEAAAGPGVDAFIQASGWATQTQVAWTAPAPPWTHKTFGDRQPTVYRPSLHGGRAALHAHSAAGNSTVRLSVQPAQGTQPDRLRFSWFVPALIEQADLRDRDVDDAVARIILSFDGDRAQHFSARDHMLSELAWLITGEPLPYATLMYVWDNRYPVGTVIPNPHTTRIQQLVVETGAARLGQWVDIERDVQADFRHAFGEAPGPLHSVGLMTDSNNTGATAQAWYGPLTLTLMGAGLPPSSTAGVEP